MRPPFHLSFVCRAACLAMLSASLLASAEGLAEGLIDIKPYVAATATYNDNLFRVSGADEARTVLGTDVMSDTTRRIEAGIDVDWKISRQHLLLGLNLNRSQFNRFNFLDNNGNSKKLAWDWTIGSHLGGEVSASESKSLSGFTEINNPARNERTSKKNLIGVNWDLHPRWRLHAQRDESEYENSLAIYRSSDRKDVAHETAAQYATPAGNLISLSARETTSEYLARDAFSTFVFGNGNRQLDQALNFSWQLDGKTRVNGRFARTERKYEELSQRNVKTWAGRLGADWQPTGKTTLSVSAVRDIYAVDDIAATYVRSDALSFSPAWAATAKLKIQARASYEKRSYQGDPGYLLGALPQREDKLESADLTVSYALDEKVQTQMTWQKESRDSSTPGGGYRARSLSASVRIEL